MKKALLITLLIAALALLPACSRGEGGAAGYGAGGGKSLREGSTAPLHSSIAQDKTYQQLLGLNILLYPPPIDDPKFEQYGAAHWELDATDFVQAMRSNFTGEMSEQVVYEPRVEALEDHPLVAQIQETIYGGQPVQVGLIYGNNGSLEFLEYNDANVTLVPAENAVVFMGTKADLDQTAWTYDTGKVKAFYFPANSVVALNPDTLRSAPIRVTDATGQLTAVILPEGTALEPASPGSGIDQAQVAQGRWVFALPGVEGGFYEGLQGSGASIEPID